MYDTQKDLLEALASTPTVLETLLRQVQGGPETLESKDEGWSVIEILCHLRDAEQRALERVRKMRTEQEPFIAAYDPEQLAEERAYKSASLQQALADFKDFRQQHLAELARLNLSDWERTGHHEELGEITISGHTLHMVSHDLSHAAQLARQLIP